MKFVKCGLAALALATVVPTFAEEAAVEENEGAIGWTPIAIGLASPVQLPWGRATWDVFGMDLGVIYADAPKMYGLGIGGIAMACRDDMVGAQISGLCNWNTKDTYGLRVSVGGNISFGTNYGMDVGAFAYREGDFWGWDTEFLGSWENNMWGLQIAGLVNVAKVQSYGAAIAIGGNYADKAYGLQLGCLCNWANELHGCQIGLVNYAYECPWGFQIGLINIIMDNRWKVLPIVNGYF